MHNQKISDILQESHRIFGEIQDSKSRHKTIFHYSGDSDKNGDCFVNKKRRYQNGYLFNDLSCN